MTAFPGFAPQAPSAPVVVDSPLPQVPGAQIPVQAGQQPFIAAPEQIVPGTTAEPDLDETAILGQSLGLDLSAFPTPEGRKAAVQWAIERYAAQGMALPVAPQQQPAQSNVSPLETDEDAPADDIAEFDLSTGITDPKVVKQIKAMEKRLAKAEAENKRIQETFATQQQAAYDNQVAELTRRTEAAIDAMASAKYGVGGQKTFAQQVSRDNLKRLAGSIIHGLQNVPNQQIPVIEQIVKLAAFYDNGGNLPQPAQNQPSGMFPPGLLTPNQQGMVPNVPAAPQQLTFRQPGAQPPVRPIVNEKDNYLRDPQYMAGAKAIMQRGR